MCGPHRRSNPARKGLAALLRFGTNPAIRVNSENKNEMFCFKFQDFAMCFLAYREPYIGPNQLQDIRP